VVFRNGLFRDLHGLFCIVKHTYQEMSGISIYESYCFFINTLYDLGWGPMRVLQGSCVRSYRDLVWVLQGSWVGPTGILDGSYRGSLAGSYRIICGLWILFSLNESVRMDCSEIYKNTNGKYPV
jgi:hypothetical protein